VSTSCAAIPAIKALKEQRDTAELHLTQADARGFSLVRQNRQGLETWMIARPALSDGEYDAVQRTSAQSTK
jgi:hypothetical protein